jgi:hypothetical protein
MAIAIEVSTTEVVEKFTANAARKTPGQTLGPNIKNAAIAIPVGGQTGVALGLKKASLKLNLPKTK